MFLMNGFSDKVKQKLGYYVYALADPRDNKIFYIGKGINNRIFQHEEKLDNSNKSNRIKEILSSGNKIKKLIISYGLSEKEAFVGILVCSPVSITTAPETSPAAIIG